MRYIAFILALFGIARVYEVRKTFGNSDRKVSGRLLHSGKSLTEALTVFHRADKALKERESIRIQIVIPLLGWMSPLVSPVSKPLASNDMYINMMRAKRGLPPFTDAEMKAHHKKYHKATMGGSRTNPPAAAAQDATVLDGADELPEVILDGDDPHVCNRFGPMIEGDAGDLRETCSICGEPQ